MKKQIFSLISIFTLLLFLVSCDIFDSPTAPEDPETLRASFSGTFWPTSVDDGNPQRCRLIVTARASGGVPINGGFYNVEWSMPWSVATPNIITDGYPNNPTVEMILPDNFGPILVRFDLEVLDMIRSVRVSKNVDLDCEIDVDEPIQFEAFSG